MRSEADKGEKISWLDVPRSIWRFLEKNKGKYVFFNILLFFIFFYTLVPPFILGKIVDFFIQYRRGAPLGQAYFYAALLGGSYVLVSFIRLTSKNVLDKIAIEARSRAKVLGFERLMEFSLKWHAQENTGNKVQRILTGSQSLHEWQLLNNRDLFPIVATFVSVLTFFLIKSPVFSLFLIVYAAIFLTVEKIWNDKIERMSDTLNEYRERSSGAYIEGAGNILAIKALGAAGSIQSKIKLNEEGAREIEFGIADASIRKWYWFQSLNGITYMLFLLLVVYKVARGDMTVGLILVFVSYFNLLREAANNSSDITNKMLQLKSDLGHMMPIFRDASPVKTGHDPFPKDWEEITIQNGTFRYPSGQVGLKAFSFHLRRGERLGIAGTSGGGKSTLVKVLLGLYELEKGAFAVDGKNYYDIAHDEIFKNIAVVLQETELFNLPLRENITVMREEDPMLLERAIDLANLKSVIDKLPEGLDTPIGERGYFLSGGERQRLGIARALYRNPDIIILDEATSSLDVKTEQRIMEELLGKLHREKTLIIIAHRLSTLRDTDRVIVLEKGNVVEDGSFKKLIRQPGSKLGHLYALQSGKNKQP